MNLVFCQFKDINESFAKIEQFLDIGTLDDMTFAKGRPLKFSGDDFRDIMAKHHPGGVLYADTFHRFTLKAHCQENINTTKRVHAIVLLANSSVDTSYGHGIFVP